MEQVLVEETIGMEKVFLVEETIGMEKVFLVEETIGMKEVFLVKETIGMKEVFLVKETIGMEKVFLVHKKARNEIVNGKFILFSCACFFQARPAPASGGYGNGGGGGEPRSPEIVTENMVPAPPPVTIVQPIRELQVSREKSDHRSASSSSHSPPPSPAPAAPTSLPQAAYNPLTEALRSVPFRLFRHLYILITVASEGMKQIPFQIAKNMQARLPPYVREIPMQLAEATQEALAIHFDSLARQIKDTVDAVRTLLDNDNSK